MANAKPFKNASGKVKEFASTDTIPTNNLATGTANSTTYLRGDQTWAVVVSGVNNGQIFAMVANYQNALGIF